MQKFSLEESPVASDAKAILTVELVDNHIYFYSQVDADRTLALIKQVRELDSRLRAEKLTRGSEQSPIWLHIQSGGGGLFAGFSVADQLARIDCPIYAIAEGLCASAATLIFLSCTKRIITANSFLLIHQLSNMMWGKYEEFKDEMKLMDMAMDKLVAFYVKYTHLKENEVREMLKHDTWLDAAECLRLGFVEEIY